uniref:Uncharacterized protein n=1 Tax=Arundo donax TaxID=35708 RepID=A0A0A9AQL1_ARUDO
MILVCTYFMFLLMLNEYYCSNDACGIYVFYVQ